MNIQKLDVDHPNYREPSNARWFVDLDGVVYNNRTKEALQKQVERTLWNQTHDARKEPWPGCDPKPPNFPRGPGGVVREEAS
jgi:hypothetical protein